MKRIALLLLMALLPISAHADNQPTGFDIVVVDTYSATDTVATAKRIDTGYSAVAILPDFTSLQFYVALDADTAWTGDTTFIVLQTSFDETYWNTYTVESFTASDTSMPAVVLKADSNVVGPYIRFRAIHWDSVEANVPALVGNAYADTLRVELRVLGR